MSKGKLIHLLFPFFDLPNLPKVFLFEYSVITQFDVIESITFNKLQFFTEEIPRFLIHHSSWALNTTFGLCDYQVSRVGILYLCQ